MGFDIRYQRSFPDVNGASIPHFFASLRTRSLTDKIPSHIEESESLLGSILPRCRTVEVGIWTVVMVVGFCCARDVWTTNLLDGGIGAAVTVFGRRSVLLMVAFGKMEDLRIQNGV